MENRNVHWVLCLSVMLAVAGFSLPAPVLSPMLLSDESGLLPADALRSERIFWLALIFIAYPIGQLLGSPLLGRWSDRIGRKKVLMFSISGSALGYLLLVIAIEQQLLGMLVLVRLAHGFTNGNVAIAQAFAADITSGDEKAKLFGKINVALNLGWIVGPLAGGYLSWLMDSYSTPFAMAALVMAFNWLLICLFLPDLWISHEKNASAEGKKVSAQKSKLLYLKALRLPFILTLISYGAINLYFSFFSTFFVEHFDAEPIDIAWLCVLVSVPMMIGSWVGARYSAAKGLAKAGVLGHTMMAVGMFTLVFAGNYFQVAATMILAGIGMTIGELATSLLVSEVAPDSQQGEAMGLYRGFTMASELIAIVIGGALVVLDSRLAFAAAAFASAVVAYLFYQSLTSSRQRQLNPAAGAVQL